MHKISFYLLKYCLFGFQIYNLNVSASLLPPSLYTTHLCKQKQLTKLTVNPQFASVNAYSCR